MDKNIGVDAERVSGLQKDLAAKIYAAVKSKNDLFLLNLEACINSDAKHAKQNIRKVLKLDYPVIDRRFGASLVEFNFKVPDNYVHSKELLLASKDNRHCFYHEEINEKNFCNVSVKLIPKKSYRVKLIPLLQEVHPNDIVAYFKKINALFVGAQGLSLIHRLHYNKFPGEENIISCDEIERLYYSPTGSYHAPLLFTGLSGWVFELTNFEKRHSRGYLLLAVFEN